MGERAEDKRLQELKDQGVELYSISRLDTINNCLYEAYLTYRLGDRGANNIYAVMGGKLHDVLEGMANGTATKEDLLPAMRAELDDMDMLDVKFPNEKIRENWIQDIEHFCETFDFPDLGKMETEQLFIYRTDDNHYINGYIDLICHQNNGTIEIYDHKSSSMYSSKDMDEHARQLLVYLMGKEQEGFKVSKIAWHFMKYVEVFYPDKKGNIKSKIVERKKIGEEMSKYIEYAMEAAGYDSFEIDTALATTIKVNKFGFLPDDIKSKFSFKPCIVEYEITQEAIDECKKYIHDTIAKWESLADKDESAYTPRKLTKIQKNGRVAQDYFYCVNLCSHFRQCPHIHDYLAKMEDKKEDEFDIF